MPVPHLEVNDVYRSENGRHFARIVEITNKNVTFELYSRRRPKPRFQLPTWFVRSPRCGWKLDKGRQFYGKADAGSPDFTP
jgi:hypothetical protein